MKRAVVKEYPERKGNQVCRASIDMYGSQNKMEQKS
jgi:hypothetical protein